MKAVRYVKEVKDSFNSCQRPKAFEPATKGFQRFYSPPLYQLSYRRKAYKIKCLKGGTYFMENLWTYKGFTKFDASFPLKREQEDEFQGISKKTKQMNRGYYTVVRRYEFYVRVARTRSHEWAQRTSEILFVPREHKIHIFELTCNVLFIV